MSCSILQTKNLFSSNVPVIRADKWRYQPAFSKWDVQNSGTPYIVCKTKTMRRKEGERVSSHTVAIQNTINNILFIIASKPSGNSTTIQSVSSVSIHIQSRKLIVCKCHSRHQIFISKQYESGWSFAATTLNFHASEVGMNHQNVTLVEHYKVTLG